MRAKKSFGQHFLIQDSIAERLADAVVLDDCKAIVEVGPGKGILTRPLLAKGVPLFAVELDRDLIPLLEREFAGSGLHLIQGDVLRVNLLDHLHDLTPFALVGNFPYNISSQIVFLALHLRHHVPFMAGMFQREMAERICSPPGSKEYGVISVLAQAYYHTELLFHVKPGSFLPPPRVNSAVISMTRYREEIDGIPHHELRKVVKQAFSQRRKKLRNTLRPLIDEQHLISLGVVDLRPEQLSIDQFISLARHIGQGA